MMATREFRPANFKKRSGLPTDWSIRKIGDVCQIFGRIGFRGYTVDDIVSKGQGAISLSPSNVKDAKLTLAKNTYISWEKWEESPEIKIVNGDIILVKTGSTVGKAAIVRGLHEPATLNPQMVVFKKRRINEMLLGYVVTSEGFQTQLTATAVGGALPTLSQKEVAGYSFACPDDPIEQQAIAEALSDADGAVEGLERLIEKKRCIKQGAMQDLLTAKRRLPGFSGEWVERKLGEIGYVKTGLTYSPDNVAKYGTLVLRSSNIQNERLAFESNVFVNVSVSDEATVLDGDLLICVRNGSRRLIGKTARIDARADGMAFGAFMSAFRSDLNDFLIWCFQSNVVQRQIEENLGATINQITNKTLKSLKVQLPLDDDERNEICRVLRDIDAEITALETRLQKACQIKEGMMQNLLTGRIRLV